MSKSANDPLEQTEYGDKSCLGKLVYWIIVFAVIIAVGYVLYGI